MCSTTQKCQEALGCIRRMAEKLSRGKRGREFRVLGTVAHVWIPSPKGPWYWVSTAPESKLASFCFSAVNAHMCPASGQSWARERPQCPGHFTPQPVVKSFHMWSYRWFVPQGEMVREVRTLFFTFFFFIKTELTYSVLFPHTQQSYSTFIYLMKGSLQWVC